ncbi:hypothetical protein CIK05_11375 [Bdellovibrio sp. qaytius]|nr:hypothetical protein CIK05_11375 [Bdellovibrio sp. qaytius]
MKNIILKNNGSTIIGTLVSVGVLVIIGGIAIQSFQDPKDSVIKIRGVSRCQEVADQINNSIQSESTIQEIAPLSQNELSQITSVSQNPFSGILNLSTNPPKLNQDKRIKGSINSLRSLLVTGADAQNRNYCSSQYGGIPANPELASLFAIDPKTLGEMKNAEVTLKVELMDLNNGTLSCDASVLPLPAGRELPAKAVAKSIVADDPTKQTKLGYQTTVFIRYKGTQDEDKICQSQSLIKYPKIYDVNLNSGSIAITIPSPTQCQATQLAGDVKVTPPANWGAQGIVPFCRDMSAAGSGQNCQGGVTATGFSASQNWLPCHLATLCGKAASTFSYNADGTIDMHYSDLPWACSARMETQFVDMGLNSLNSAFIASNVVNFPGCDSCGNYGWLGGSFCPTGAYTSYCSPPPPPPPPAPPSMASPPVDTSSPEWIVRNAYQTILGRDPDAGGAHFWVGLMNGGMTVDQLFGNIGVSMENRMQNGESFSQAQIDEHNHNYDLYNNIHNISTPTTLCDTYGSCSTHWSD